MKKNLFLIAVFFMNWASAQIENEIYFSDSTDGYLDRLIDVIKVEDGMIISGAVKSQINNSYHPCVIKLNTSGDVLWSTLNSTVLNYQECNNFNIEVFEDGYIYGTSTNYLGFNDRFVHVWKINKLNGSLSWSNLFYTSNYDMKDIADFDSSSFLLAFPDDNGISTVALIDKSLGNIVNSHSFEFETNSLNLAVDANKNVFYSVNNRLRKFNRNNFFQVIWDRTYTSGANDLNEIHELYLDKYGELFVFGRDGWSTTGNGICLKVDVADGSEIWNKILNAGDLKISDFKDRNGKLYVSHRTTLVGGGTYTFQIAKVDKESGSVNWFTNLNCTPLGSPANHSGNNQAALGIDLDCSGNVYVTGYYGDANYGPEAWGIMKLNGANGVKLYDLTITVDSINYDNYSTGLHVCVFGDSPVILGYQDDYATSNYPLFVVIEPSAGAVLLRKRIGGKYQQYSSTVDISRFGNKTYVLEQRGKEVVIEQYNISQSLDWQQVLTTSGVLFADQFNVNSDNIYVTSHRNAPSQNLPFYQNETASLIFYKLDRMSGAILDSDSIVLNQVNAKNIELESDVNQAFVFYTLNENIYYVKWLNSNISSPFLFQPLNANSNFEGQLNLISNKSTTNLIAVGSDNLFSINKSSLVKTPLFSYTPRTTFDHLWLSDTLVVCGKNTSEIQQISAFNFNSGVNYWQYSSGLQGKFTKIESDNSGSLYCAGSDLNKISLSKIDQIDGNEIWKRFGDTLSHPNSTERDLLINLDKEYVAVCGSINNPSGSSDALIYYFGVEGQFFQPIIKADEIENLSFTSCLVLLDDNQILAGGSHNRVLFSKEGFVFKVDFNLCDFVQSTISNYMTSLVALQGMDEYQWLDCNNNYNPIIGATSEIFNPQVNGSYAVQVTFGACSAVSACALIYNLQLDKLKESQIYIYPNPSRNIINIVGTQGNFEYEIYDPTGKLIEENTTTMTYLNIESYGKGIYYIKIIENNTLTTIMFSKM